MHIEGSNNVIGLISVIGGGGGGSGGGSATGMKNSTIPGASITIDGNIDDWASLEPFYVDKANDENPKSNLVGTDLKGVYLARDEEFLYILFTLYDGDPNEAAQYASGPPGWRIGSPGRLITLPWLLSGTGNGAPLVRLI